MSGERPQKGGCLAPARLGVLAGGGALSPAERRHAALCVRCREALASLAELERELGDTLAQAAHGLRSQCDEIQLRLAELAPLVAASRPRRRGPWLLATIYACAALLLLVAWLGYAVAWRLELRARLASAARQDVRNVGLVLRRWAASGRPLPERLDPGLLRAAGLELPARWRRGEVVTDPFGQPLRLRRTGRGAVLYSAGPNGRDEGGRGDDIAFVVAER
ncbi:MAG: hypothetical protein D6776_07055 [Planctomycetota bacterium]|nr:MAG: hypothetical protein D6776_07055 [Planctomycetota bacterium]